MRYIHAPLPDVPDEDLATALRAEVGSSAERWADLHELNVGRPGFGEGSRAAARTERLMEEAARRLDVYSIRTDDAARDLRAAADHIVGLDSMLRIAYTALERCSPDIHDAAWVRDTVMPSIKQTLGLR